MQSDVLCETLTVRETLQFYAKLKIGNDDGAQEKVKFLVRKMKL